MLWKFRTSRKYHSSKKNKMKKLIYFHGLGSNKNSRKFRLLKDHLGDGYEFLCAEWNVHTDFRILMFNIFKRLLREPEVILIGDSTGGNYACQMRDLLTQNNIKATLVLLNPLLSIDKRIATFPFPERLLESLLNIRQVDDCLSITSINDVVIDHSLITYGPGTSRLIVDDVHQLLHFERYLPHIDRYIDSHNRIKSNHIQLTEERNEIQ